MKETAYLLQAVLIGAWWVGLAASNTFFMAFQFDGMPPESFWAFMIPDVILIGSLSFIRSYWRIATIEFVILGAFAYATLYCVNASILTCSGYLPTGLMILGLGYNGFLSFNESMFRASKTGMVWNLTKTLVQIVCIWLLALGVIPYVILDAFGADVSLKNNLNTLLGFGGFAGFSILGLFSAYFMVRDGAGTPLPLDQTNQLVVSGPYQFVRNPMAIAGIGQGVAVAVVFQSLPVLMYALLGAVVWHVVVRPFEERDLLDRFGESYLEYRQRVPCWYPTFRKWVDHSGKQRF